MKKPVPVILDTDIGSDLDDTWALAMALKSPEIDLKLVTVTEFDVEYQAKLAAKMLQIAGRSDIPVGIGISSGKYEGCCNIREWVEDYDLSTYPNVREDGVQALIDTIMASDEKVTILAIGAFRNLAAAVEREPRIKEKSKILGVCANIYNGAFRGMNWFPPLGRESNIWCDVNAYRRSVEVEGWEVEIVPLDLTGGTILDCERYAKIQARSEHDPLIKALMENCEIWYKNMNFNFYGQSSCLFDTVGVYAAFTHENMNYQRLPLYVNDDSITLIDPMRGKYMDIAITWDDKDRFYTFLTARMCDEI
ncbi:MAG: nucleoside hydrolase [Clostridia bacterium]|nr:nucleoside hydrolase [Clostridia bacterium]